MLLFLIEIISHKTQSHCHYRQSASLIFSLTIFNLYIINTRRHYSSHVLRQWNFVKQFPIYTNSLIGTWNVGHYWYRNNAVFCILTEFSVSTNIRTGNQCVNELFFDRIENIVRKGENFSYQNLFFSHYFKIASFSGLFKGCIMQ